MGALGHMQVITMLESLVAVLATQFLLAHMVLVLNLLLSMLAILGTMLVTPGFVRARLHLPGTHHCCVPGKCGLAL